MGPALPRGMVVAGVALAALLSTAFGACAAPGPGGTPPTAATRAPSPVATGECQAVLGLPSIKGLNYDRPAAANGQWLGTRWLRAAGSWDAARPRLQADLDLIVAHHLGRVQRLSTGLAQLMFWDSSSGFVRFDDAALRNLNEALDMSDGHQLKVLAVYARRLAGRALVSLPFTDPCPPLAQDEASLAR